MWSQLFHSIILALAISLLYQVNTSFFQVLMEIIDTYEPLSPDPAHPNVMRIVWHVVVFGCSLVLALMILALHPLSRKVLLVKNEKETVNINNSYSTPPPLHPQKMKKKKKTHHQGTQSSSDSESELD